MNQMTQQEFDVLAYLEMHQRERVTQTDIAKANYISIGSVNKIVRVLKEQRYLLEETRSVYTISEEGYVYLKPFRVKRAVLIAAGFGSRLIPITLNTPKPLVRVHGKRIIETLLDALLEKGIEEIHIVRGYLGEQFNELKEKYPMIQLYTNDKYNTSNNISSAALVKEKYENAYVMDADLYLRNPDVIRRYECQCNYLGVYVEETDDWRLVLNNRKVKGMQIGGKDCYQMIGLSYWTKEAAQQFKNDIEAIYHSPGGKECYWDDVVLGKFNSHYHIGVRNCRFEDIIEIDTFDELKQIDPVYASH